MRLYGHSDLTMDKQSETIGEDTLKHLIQKVKHVKEGNKKGLILYVYWADCMHCQNYNSTWDEACKDCPSDMLTSKVNIEEFNKESEHKYDEILGDTPSSFPTVYSYTKNKDDTIMRKDHSSRRQHIKDILDKVNQSGHDTFKGTNGEETTVYTNAISTPTHFPTPGSDIAMFEFKQKTPQKNKKLTIKKKPRKRKQKKINTKKNKEKESKKKESKKKGRGKTKRKR